MNENQNLIENAIIEVPIDRSVVGPTLFVVISQIVGMVSSIILIPVGLAAFGAEQYALLVLLQSTLSIFAMADFGMGASVKNYIANEKTKGNWNKINQAVSSFTLLYLVIGFIIFIICLLSVQLHLLPWSSILNIQSDLVPVASRLIIIVGLIIAVRVIASLWLNVFQGLQMVSWIYKFDIAVKLIQLFVVWIAIKIIPKIEVYCFLQGIFTLLTPMILIPIAFRRFHNFRPIFPSSLWKIIKPLFSTSVLFFILMINSFIFTSTDNLVLTHLIGLNSITFYSLSYKLFAFPASFLGSIGIVLWPLLSCLSAKNLKTDLQVYYTWILRYTVIAFMGSMLFILMISDILLLVWLGEDSFQGFPLMLIFTFTTIIFSWGGVHALFCNSMGKLKFQVIASSFGVIINIVLSIILTKKIGQIGVAIGTLCGTILGTALPLSWYVSKLINVNPIKELGKVLQSYIGPLIFFISALFLIRIYALNVYLKLYLSGIMGCLFIFFTIRFTLHKDEKQFLFKSMGKIGYVISYFFK